MSTAHGDADAHAAHAALYQRVHPLDYVQQFLAKEVRPDGRRFGQCRKTTLALGTIATADASAVVRIGNTSVVCGIKLELANPPLDHPDHGWLVANATLSGLCAPHFSSGPPAEPAQTLSHFIQSTLLKAGIVDLRDLCIVPGKLSWCAYVDAVCISDDGNVTDACWLATVAALQQLRLPLLAEVDPASGAIPAIVPGPGRALSPVPLAVAVTFGVVPAAGATDPAAASVVIDPSAEEQAAQQTSVTVVLRRGGEIAAIAKPSLAISVDSGPCASPSLLAGGLGVSQRVLRECIARAAVRAEQVTTLWEEINQQA